MSFNMMASLKCLVVSSIAFNGLALAEDKGNETGNRDMPVSTASIIKIVNEEKTYKIDKEVEGCPSYIQLKKNNEVTSDKVLEFFMDGYEKSNGIFNLESSNFWHENNHFKYDIVQKEGKKSHKDNGCSIIAGVACSSRYQLTNKDSIVFEGGAKILSLAMIASTNYSIKFDTANDKISYFFKGNGIEDVLCTYSAAPGFEKEIQAYRDARQKRLSRSVNDSKRENGKDVAPESDSSGTKAKATTSK